MPRTNDGDPDILPEESGDRADRSRAPRPNDPFGPLQIVWLRVDEIDEAPRRIRKPVQTQIVAVRRSIERYGNRIPILVQAKSAGGRHEVIDGHTRLAAARLIGAREVPCLVVGDLPEAEIRRLALSLNRLQERGAWDRTELRLEIGDLIALDDDYELPGFDVAEIEALLLDDEGADSDPADDLSGLGGDEGVVTRESDLWHLGTHRILCGSARDAGSYDRALTGATVDAIWTDPPYNVKINGHVRLQGQGFAEFREASGEMTRDEFIAFLSETLGRAAAHLKPGGVLFVCMDWRHLSELDAALAALGLTLLNICVWVKPHPGQGSLYRSQHEFVVVARKPGARHRNNVQLGVHGRSRSNVWTYAGATGGRADGDDDFAAHPTVKPIRLIRDALLDVTIPGELVLDPFAGAGSTILAAERARRCCVATEIEPAYVDVAVRRWQAMTGEEAIHARTGQSFAAVAASRERDGGGAPSDDAPGCVRAPEADQPDLREF